LKKFHLAAVNGDEDIYGDSSEIGDIEIDNNLVDANGSPVAFDNYAYKNNNSNH
jgi:hypothetical protein